MRRVGFLDHLFERGPEIGFGRHRSRAGRLRRSAAQPRQRRLQIMRDIVRHLAHDRCIRHADTVEHRVEVAARAGQARRWSPQAASEAGQIARDHDRLRARRSSRSTRRNTRQATPTGAAERRRSARARHERGEQERAAHDLADSVSRSARSRPTSSRKPPGSTEDARDRAMHAGSLSPDALDRSSRSAPGSLQDRRSADWPTLPAIASPAKVVTKIKARARLRARGAATESRRGGGCRPARRIARPRPAISASMV